MHGGSRSSSQQLEYMGEGGCLYHVGITIKYESGMDGGSHHKVLPLLSYICLLGSTASQTHNQLEIKTRAYGHQTQTKAGTDERCPESIWDDALLGRTASIDDSGEGKYSGWLRVWTTEALADP